MHVKKGLQYNSKYKTDRQNFYERLKPIERKLQSIEIFNENEITRKWRHIFIVAEMTLFAWR